MSDDKKYDFSKYSNESNKSLAARYGVSVSTFKNYKNFERTLSEIALPFADAALIGSSPNAART